MGVAHPQHLDYPLDRCAWLGDEILVTQPQVVGRRRRENPLDELTPREREVLELMAEGYSNRAIAAQMVVTERAVEKHVTNIFRKLGFASEPAHHRRVLAVLAFVRSDVGG